MNAKHNPHKRLDGKPPHVLESSDPPGKRVTIVDEECDNCGFDRLKVTQTAGPTTKRCLFCDASKFNDDEWEQPETDRDRLREMREYVECDGPVTKLGEYGVTSRFTHGDEVFRNEDTGTVNVFEHGRNGTSVSRTRITEDVLVGILNTLDDSDAVDLLADALRDDLSRGVAATKLMPDEMMDGLTDDE